MAVNRVRAAALRFLGRRTPSAEEPETEVERLMMAVGRMEARHVRSVRYDRLQDAEFRIFSQFGEDGIIQYLVGKVPIINETFVEFGVQDYRESNTRFLLTNNDWRGLILDAGSAHVDFVRGHPIGWRHSIDARSAFITRENINDLLGSAGFRGDIGLLSVDIDGNDYWVLDAIDVVKPRILVVEYNSTFGPDAAVSVPYDPAFDRTKAHWSNLYWGSSISAICMAAERKGMGFVGSNRAGNNAFFVRYDFMGELTPIEPKDGWIDAGFRESRDASGELTHVTGRASKVAVIGHLPLVDVATGQVTTVAACLQTRRETGDL